MKYTLRQFPRESECVFLIFSHFYVAKWMLDNEQVNEKSILKYLTWFPLMHFFRFILSSSFGFRELNQIKQHAIIGLLFFFRLHTANKTEILSSELKGSDNVYINDFCSFFARTEYVTLRRDIIYIKYPLWKNKKSLKLADDWRTELNESGQMSNVLMSRIVYIHFIQNEPS